MLHRKSLRFQVEILKISTENFGDINGISISFEIFEIPAEINDIRMQIFEIV